MFNPVQFYEFGKSRGLSLLNNLIAYYNGNSQISSTGSNDLIANNRVTFASGIIGNSFEFASNPAFADVPNSTSTQFGNLSPFSISIWIFPTSNTTQFAKWVISKRLAGGNNSDEYQLLLTNSYVVNFSKFNAISPGSNFTRAVGPTLPLSQWSHIVIADDGSTNANSTKIYFNGALFNSTYTGSGTFTGMGISNATTRIGLAQFNQGGGFQFAGRLDEIGLYKNRELSQSDVSALYNAGAGITYPF